MKKMMVMVLAGASVLLSVHGARDLKLTGSGSPAIWDNGTTATWLCNGETVTFSAGDNVTIDDTFTGDSLMMKNRVCPGNLLFDISRTIRFGWNTVNDGLHIDSGLFVKKGTGTLLLVSDLSGSEKNASGGITTGNAETSGVDIVAGQIALKNRNNHNFLGPRMAPFWVRVRDGASLSFLQGNQSGTHTSTECGLCLQLDPGGKLNHVTNAVSSQVSSALCLNTLRLCGGEIVNGARAYMQDDARLGGNCCMKIFNALHFSGTTPHAFGYADGTYAGCKSYTLADTLRNFPISLNSYSPVEFCVDEITGNAEPDVYVQMRMFTYGTNTVGVYKSDIVKIGEGTLVFPDTSMQKKFYGNFTVTEGTAEFRAQGFFPAETDGPAQTLAVSTNGTLRLSFRNVVTGTATERPNIKVVVDHGRFEFVTTTGAHGSLRAREWVFDDPILDIRNAGMSQYFGVFGFLGPVTFLGTKPISIVPYIADGYTAQNQLIQVYNNPRTEFNVAEMTGDAVTDVTLGMGIYNAATGTTASCVLPDCGFVKKGPGTLSIAGPANGVSGCVTASEGVLRIDGKLITPSAVEIENGALLGGTGMVARVSLAAGSGFAVRASEKGCALTINGDLALPSSGVIVLDAPADQIGKTGMKIAHVTGTVSGSSDLSGWKLKDVSGTVIHAGDALSVRNGDLYLRGGGLVMVLR